MAGRRLVDAAKLFNAAKSVAGKHANLRSQQLDVYSKTSTLAKAVKNQTDRVVLTTQAAIVLAKRLNEEAPAYASAAARRATGTQSDHIPKEDTVRGQPPREDIRDGIEQDHHYDRSGKNSAAEPPAQGELDVEQKEAERRPLPDGTIPSSGLRLENDNAGQDTFSERPIPEAPKQPLAEEDHQESQRQDHSVRPVESTASTIPTPSKSYKLSADETKRLQQEDESRIPSKNEAIQKPPKSPVTEKLVEGHDRDVFYIRSKETQTEPSSLPRMEIPKHTEDQQESDGHVADGQLNQDVYYAIPEPGQEALQHEALPNTQAVPEQEQVPEGINTDVFRTTRVAKMLGGNPYKDKTHLNMQGTSKTPHDHTKIALGHDQDTFNVRSSKQDKPSIPEQFSGEPETSMPTAEKEMHDFASQLAKDAESAPSPISEVCSPHFSQHWQRMLMR
jgi:aarF domain-containing kinase